MNIGSVEDLINVLQFVQGEWGNDSNIVIQLYDDNKIIAGNYLLNAYIRNDGTIFLTDYIEDCNNCKHNGKFENEIEFGYSSPCTTCQHRVSNNFTKGDI